MDLHVEKLQKLYALASNNPNQNEAIVAAHKFINAIKKDGLHMIMQKSAVKQTGDRDVGDINLKNNGKSIIIGM